MSQYGLDAIALFRQYTRESYELEFCVQPPPFDLSRPIQTWFDTEDKGFDQAYLKLTAGDLEEFRVGPIERSTPNLPGRYVYPKPQYAATAAVQVSPNGDRQLLYGHMLTTRAEAEQIMREIGGDTVYEEQNPIFPYVYPPEETRRIHVITRAGSSMLAWQLRRLQTAHGLGALGHWDLSDPQNLRWVGGPFPDGAGCDDYMPVPVRDLHPNERVVTGFGGLPVIQRTDLTAQGAVVFSEGDRSKLNSIFAWVNRQSG